MKTDYRKHDDTSEQLNILKIVNQHRRITRRQIVEMTGFSQAKISLVIGELVKSGLLEEVDEGASSGGRRARLLQVSGTRGMVLGLELGGYEEKLSLIDFSGSLHAQAKMPSPADGDPDATVAELHRFIEGFLRQQPTSSPVRGLGLALSGIVDRSTGRSVYFRNRKSWEGFPLRTAFEERLGLPCVIDDSSRMMAVAEKSFGSCLDTDNFVLISIGVGTGCGIYLGGELFRGGSGFGGELGHMVIKENGPRCVCGNYGCLESFVSGYAIERQLRVARQDNVYSSLMALDTISAREVVEHAEAGDKLAYSIITEAGKHLGIGIANMINIFNPRKVVLAGGISRAGRLLLEPVEQVVRASALSLSVRNCEILLSPLDEYAAARGAAHDWFATMLQDPRAKELILA
jgi:N-acetylglucosamine repressor